MSVTGTGVAGGRTWGVSDLLEKKSGTTWSFPGMYFVW